VVLADLQRDRTIGELEVLALADTGKVGKDVAAGPGRLDEEGVDLPGAQL
jgi:hypothetical protein